MMDSERPEITVFSGVYPPSEDTYLLLDSLDIRKEDTFLEVGCGTGVISVSVAGQIERVVCLDSSFDAVRNTKENLRRNNISHRCHVIEADLLSALSPSVKFSLIVFNPPYLPQDETHTDLDQALVGGETGTETTQRFIRQAVEHLLKNGRVYVVVSSLANIDSIQQTMIDSGLSVGIVSEASLFFEKIQVLRGVL
jgi:release factor glutamine methyltransferase